MITEATARTTILSFANFDDATAQKLFEVWFNDLSEEEKEIVRRTSLVLFNEMFGPVLEAIRSAFEQMAVGLQNYFTHMSEVLYPLLNEFNEAIHLAYREAGSPYGETEEGLQRWLDELGKDDNPEA